MRKVLILPLFLGLSSYTSFYTLPPIELKLKRAKIKPAKPIEPPKLVQAIIMVESSGRDNAHNGCR